VLALSGLVPLGAWAIGITRLPPGSTFEIGLWLLAGGSVAVVLGPLLELLARGALRRAAPRELPPRA
jgi:hypothetical protein